MIFSFLGQVMQLKAATSRSLVQIFLARLIELPVIFRWIAKLVSKHKMVAAVSAAEVPNGRRGKHLLI